MRSKTSIEKFRKRFSSSSEDGKEGWNSLETTPIGRKHNNSKQNIEKVPNLKSDIKKVIVLDNDGVEVFPHLKAISTKAVGDEGNDLGRKQKM